jgi:hypothetical protein
MVDVLEAWRSAPPLQRRRAAIAVALCVWAGALTVRARHRRDSGGVLGGRGAGGAQQRARRAPAGGPRRAARAAQRAAAAPSCPPPSPHPPSHLPPPPSPLTAPRRRYRRCRSPQADMYFLQQRPDFQERFGGAPDGGAAAADAEEAVPEWRRARDARLAQEQAQAQGQQAPPQAQQQQQQQQQQASPKA